MAESPKPPASGGRRSVRELLVDVRARLAFATDYLYDAWDALTAQIGDEELARRLYADRPLRGRSVREHKPGA